MPTFKAPVGYGTLSAARTFSTGVNDNVETAETTTSKHGRRIQMLRDLGLHDDDDALAHQPSDSDCDDSSSDISGSSSLLEDAAQETHSNIEQLAIAAPTPQLFQHHPKLQAPAADPPAADLIMARRSSRRSSAEDGLSRQVARLNERVSRAQKLLLQLPTSTVRGHVQQLIRDLQHELELLHSGNMSLKAKVTELRRSSSNNSSSTSSRSSGSGSVQASPSRSARASACDGGGLEQEASQEVVRSLQQQLQHTEAIHQHSMAQLMGMAKDLAQHATAAQQHQQQQTALQQQVAKLQQELQAARQQLQQSQGPDLQEALEQARGQLEQSRQQLKQLQLLQSQGSGLTEEGPPSPVADMRRDWRLRELRCDKEALQAHVAGLQADNAVLQARLAQALDRAGAARAELQVRDGEVERLRQQLSGGGGGNVQQLLQGSRMHEQMHELDVTECGLTETKRELDTARSELDETKHEMDKAKCELSTAQCDLTKAQCELGSANHELVVSRSEAQQLREQLAAVVTELAGASSERSRLQAKLQQLQVAMSELEQLMEEQQQQLELKQQQLEEQQQAVALAAAAARASEQVHHSQLRALQQAVASQAAEVSAGRQHVRQQLQLMQRQLAASSQEFTTRLQQMVVVQQQLAMQRTRQAVQQARREQNEQLAQLLQRTQQLQADLDQERGHCVQQLQQLHEQSQQQAVQARAELEEYKQRWQQEFDKRRKLHDLVVELKGNIRVIARIRPPTAKEARASPLCGSIKAAGSEHVRLEQPGGQSKVYEFDAVLGPEGSQQDVFAELAPLATSVLDGYNVCIMAYGQTGSGKTHTMEGPRDAPGINPQMLTQLFSIAEDRHSQWSYSFQASVLEIYNEQIFDLLVASGREAADKLDIKEGPAGIFVAGLTVRPVANLADVLQVIDSGKANRSTFATNMNEHSSRSHLVLSVYVVGQARQGGSTCRGKLHLIDLAGSERLSKSGAEGDRLREAQSINKSLSALGDVVQALQTRATFVPYRNSKLTRLLEDSLGSSSKCVMLVNCSSAADSLGETKCSLEFASRARKVELGKAKQNLSSSNSEPASPQQSPPSDSPCPSPVSGKARSQSAIETSARSPARKSISVISSRQ